MTEIEFAAFLVSRVCHDLVGPLGAVINGLEVLEDERDPALQADALKLVASSAENALAKLQFMRLAFGAAGSAGTEIDLRLVHDVIRDLVKSGRVSLEWQPPATAWAKDWAKLLMNAALVGVDSLPRGGVVCIDTGDEAHFRIVARGTGARISPETARALAGEGTGSAFDARGIQQVLTVKLAGAQNAAFDVVAKPDAVEIVARLPRD